MYAITYKGKIVTRQQTSKILKNDNWQINDDETIYAGKTKGILIEAFIYRNGFTWKEYTVDGWNIQRIGVVN